jgi:hypothetical protein
MQGGKSTQKPNYTRKHPMTMHPINFSTGRLTPIEPSRLPLGQVVAYEDMANPYHEAVVTGSDNGHGQPVTFLDDGHQSSVFATSFGRSGWRLVDRVMPGPELAEALRTAQASRIRIEAERKAASAAEQAARDAERRRIAAQYPWLTTADAAPNRSRHAIGAANLTRMLRRQWPGIAFRVTSKSYSMGSSISVSWTDGPTTEQVDEIADRFEMTDFDAMEDLKTFRSSVWPDVFGGAHHVIPNRCHSNAAYDLVAAHLGYTEARAQENDYRIANVCPEASDMIRRATWRVDWTKPFPPPDWP